MKNKNPYGLSVYGVGYLGVGVYTSTNSPKHHVFKIMRNGMEENWKPYGKMATR